jgi:hypothetical protein
MTTVDFSVAIQVDASPEAVYNAVNSPEQWWSMAVDGAADKRDAEFFHRYRDFHYCKLKVDELIPGKRVAWLVLDNYFSFIKDQSEWKGTRIIFDIAAVGDRTELRFTHEGLVPEDECYQLCESEWTKYITKSLHGLITTGKGSPNAKDDLKYDAAFESWKPGNQ